MNFTMQYCNNGYCMVSFWNHNEPEIKDALYTCTYTPKINSTMVFELGHSSRNLVHWTINHRVWELFEAYREHENIFFVYTYIQI